MQIPRDVEIEILVRLPTKQLLVSKSICKHWYYLISSPEFAKLHLKYLNNIQKHDRIRQIFQSSHKELGMLNLQHGGIGSLAKVNLKMSVEKIARKFDVRGCPVAGSSNGLICYIVGKQRQDLCIWNACTSEQRLVQGPNTDTSYIGLHWGFGYDSLSDDYKTVILGRHTQLVAHLFSLRTGQWRQIHINGFIPDNISRKQIGCCLFVEDPVPVQVGNDLHWLEGPTILRFDLTRELFTMIPTPLPDTESCYYFLSQVNQGLCVCVAYYNGSDLTINGWVLEQVSDVKSWKTFCRLRGLDRWFRSKRMYPYLFSFQDNSNHVFIFDENYNVYIADSRGERYLPQQHFIFKVPQSTKRFHLFPYAESLVSPFLCTRTLY